MMREYETRTGIDQTLLLQNLKAKVFLNKAVFQKIASERLFYNAELHTFDEYVCRDSKNPSVKRINI